MNYKFVVSLVIVLLTIPVRVWAGGDEEAKVRDVVLANAAAFERGDFDGIAKVWAHDENIVVIESGHVEVGWQEFGEKHLKPELGILKNVVYKLDDLRVRVNGNAAWASFTYNFEADVQDRHIVSQGVGTMVLEKREGRWLIVHSHTTRVPKKDQ